jgi:hypothetical protein
MALLPEKLRYRFFDRISLQTMRYVDTVPLKKAEGKLKEMYAQINRDFFINGSLTSRSTVENIFAAAWVLGRETILVDDKVDRTTKEALAAILSGVNDCPYCGDMLVSLIHAGDRSDDAMKILDQEVDQIDDPVLRERLVWVKQAITSADNVPQSPFSEAELPEVIGSVMAMSDVNRFSHIVMAGSPVQVPNDSSAIKKAALKIFGNELKESHATPLIKGDSLKFLPDAELPKDMAWAKPNKRIAQAVARWCAATENELDGIVSADVKDAIHQNLSSWDGKQMPLGRYWVEDETRGFKGRDRIIARFILLMAKASYQIDEAMHEELLGIAGSKEDFIRILAWGSYVSARYLANRIAASVRHVETANRSHLTEAA